MEISEADPSAGKKIGVGRSNSTSEATTTVTLAWGTIPLLYRIDFPGVNAFLGNQ